MTLHYISASRTSVLLGASSKLLLKWAESRYLYVNTNPGNPGCVHIAQLEVCVDRIDDAVEALEAGASRIEFNCALAEDGLTPSLGTCRILRELTDAPIVAMVRPHNVGFIYSPHEKQAMLDDCQRVLEIGINGIAIGALTSTGDLDLEFLKLLPRQFPNTQFVMHRAFDRLRDQSMGLEQLIEFGFTRVLTSGDQPSALAGVDQLNRLVKQAGQRIEILPGGGVSEENAAAILQATGAHQLHGSFSRRHDGRRSLDVQQIRDVRKILSAAVGEV